jgi:LAO/AO transport system kinase
MPTVQTHGLDALTQGVLAGEVRSIARAITLVESREPARLELLERLFPYTGRAFKVGITGAPGAGKSTLTYQLIPRLKARGYRVGVLAVDPTSPFSGGAILGDRVRFDDALEGVYIRSLASRGSLGGLSRGVPPAVRVLEAAGYDLVIIETVGAGQLQVDVRFVADTVVLALVPEAGDVIQAMKAGIIEIADIYVINKADREGATRMRLDLRNALELGGKPKGWNPPITLTEAIHGKGVDELVEFIEEHKQYQQQSGGWETRRLQQLEWELQSLIHDALEQHARATTQQLFTAERLQAVLQGVENPFPTIRAWSCMVLALGGPKYELCLRCWGQSTRLRTPVHASPVSQSVSSARHSTCSIPPGICTCAVRSSLPVWTPATTMAHAPVPHASVAPAPRSHTRARTQFGASTCATDTFTRSGNSGACSNCGPERLQRKGVHRVDEQHEVRRACVDEGCPHPQPLSHLGEGGRVARRPCPPLPTRWERGI